MRRVILFGGTTEGRELAEFCRMRRIPVLVCVVSEYGANVLEESDSVKIRQGTLDRDQMEALFLEENPMLVVDATHPYAVAVTENLREICERLKLSYLRVLRGGMNQAANTGGEQGHGLVIPVQDCREAVQVLLRDERPVLVTTGSKELKVFTELPGYEERLFARVLPDGEVISQCELMGIRGRHLIAMQGPFSKELNSAIMRQIQAGWLVTKESGSRGGFLEKLDAALECGVSVIVIGRPGTEAGIDLEGAKRRLLVCGEAGRRRLALIGTGMGGSSQLTLEAVSALKECEAVLGAPRMLADLAPFLEGKVEAFVYLGHEILDWADAHPQFQSIAALYSGDTGFYSGTHSLFACMKERGVQEDWETTVYPGISTVSCLCARLKTSWEGIYLGSLHGRECDAPGLLRRHERVFFLLGGKTTLAEFCKILVAEGFSDSWVSVGERLGYPEERIFCGEAKTMTETETDSLLAVLVERKKETFYE